MNKAFEIIDHTADVGIIIYGADVEELFSNAALGLFSVITELENVEGKRHIKVEVSSRDRDSLLVDWLNELIFLFDVKHMLFNRFDVEILTHKRLKAVCYGEDFDSLRHKIRTGVKAATYYMLQLDRSGDGYKAQVIFDV